MAESYFGFNTSGTAPGDRAYSASDYMSWMSAQFADQYGVIKGIGTELTVSSLGGYIISISAGACVLNGYVYRNTTALSKTLTTAGSGYQRYDKIVVRLDFTSARKFTVYIIEGTPAISSPTIPTAGSGDVPLANILINNSSGTPTFTVSDIRSFRTVYTNQNILANDGAGSGLDADLLDGIDSTAFSRVDKILFLDQTISADANINTSIDVGGTMYLKVTNTDSSSHAIKTPNVTGQYKCIVTYSSGAISFNRYTVSGNASIEGVNAVSTSYITIIRTV